MATTLEKLEQLNFSKPTEALCRDLIYLHNGIQLPNQIRFGLVNPLTPDLTGPVPNTSVVVTNTVTQQRQPYNYYRIPLSLVKRGLQRPLPVTQEVFKTEDVLASLNVLWQTKLTIQDVVNTTYLATSNVITIQAHPRSLAWVGSVEVTLNDRVERFLTHTTFTLPTVRHVLEDAQAVYQALSLANGRTLSPTNLALAPTVELPNALTGPYNTALTVQPVGQAKLITCHYNRLKLSDVYPQPADLPPVYIDALPVTLHELLHRINVNLWTCLTPDQVENYVIDRQLPYLTLTIRSDQSSYYWLKSSVRLPVVWDTRLRFTTDGVVRRTTDGVPRTL